MVRNFSVFPLSRARFFRSDWLVRAHLPKKIDEHRRFFAFGRAIWRDGPRFWLARAPPGPVLGSENRGFSLFLGARARSVRFACEVYKTIAGATFFVLRSYCAKTQKRQKIVPRARSTVFDALHALGHLTKTVRRRLGTAPGSLFDVSWAVLASPGRPKIDLGPIFGRPNAAPSAS